MSDTLKHSARFGVGNRKRQIMKEYRVVGVGLNFVSFERVGNEYVVFFHGCSLSVRADKAFAVRYDGKLEVVALTVSVYHGIGIAM